MYDLLQRGGDVDLRAAAGDQVPELLGGQPGAAVQRHRDAGGLDQVGDPLVRRAPARRLYWPCALPIAGAKQSTPVRLMKSTATSRLCCAGRLVGADAVLDALDALDLALDVRAVPAGLGDDLGGLPQVLGHVQLVRVEEHRVPAAGEAVGDDRRGPGSGRGAG